MAFLCPARRRKGKQGLARREDAPLPGRITGSDSIDTLVRVGLEKERGPRARMVIIHDFTPCVDDELQVHRGQQVNVLYQENDWLYVITSDNSEGFVPYNYCLPLERSVDDFALPKPAGKPSKSHAIESGNTVLTRSNSRSMPDVASIGNVPPEQSGGRDLFKKANSVKGRSKSSDKKSGNKSKGQNLTGVENDGFLEHSIADSVVPQSPDLLPISSIETRFYGNSDIVKPKAMRPSKGKQKERSDSFKRATQNHNTSPPGPSTSTLLEQSHVLMEHKQSENIKPLPDMNNYSSYSGFDTIKTSEHLINTSSEHLLPGPVKPFSKRPQGKFIVLFSFNALEENDVSVTRGEFVTLLNKEDPEWFWVLRTDGHDGFVPSTFLCPAEGQITDDLASQGQQTSTATPVSSVESNSDPPRKKSLTKLGCLYDYNAEAPDHVSVKRGESLYADMESQTNSAWIYVYSPETGESGFIPRSHAKPLNLGFHNIELNGHVPLNPLDPYISP